MFPQYLVKNPSNTSFFFRTIIPLDIRDLFGGIKEFRVSLKCVSKVESKKICLHLNNRVETIYEQIRMGKSLTIDEMKRILKKTKVPNPLVKFVTFLSHFCHNCGEDS